MTDPNYEQTREERALQSRKLLEKLSPIMPTGRLLDVGASSGILIEEALKMGYQAEGIEPSDWLVDQAKRRNLPVHHGILPHPSVNGPFDIATLVDVLEHVSDPMGLLRETKKLLSPKGIIFVVTPNVSSLAARLFGKRWWHFRIAHIGYFNKSNLDYALSQAGFTKKKVFHPSWYFPADYLIQRLNVYLPGFSKIKFPSFVNKMTIPLNLFDSIGAFYQVKN